MSSLAEYDSDNPLTPLQAVSCNYPIALWLRASLKGLILIESGESLPNSARLAAMDFFSGSRYLRAPEKRWFEIPTLRVSGRATLSAHPRDGAAAMSTSPAPDLQMGILQRRRIEAEIIKPIYEEMKAAFGEAAAKGVIERAVRKAAIEAGKQFAAQEKGGTSLASFAAIQPLWTKEDALRVKTLRQDAEHLDFDVVRCRYAEMYREMGLDEIGHLLSCNRDGTFIQGYDARIEFRRSQTIMGGASYCDFRYRMPAKKEG